MDTIENNKLIAEFLGATDKHIENFGGAENLKYHSDWNWLMSVVEKIENLSYDVQIILDFCTITNGDYSKTTQLGGAKIHNVYNACVEFIKWRNENK
jgi:hypothetical protein